MEDLGEEVLREADLVATDPVGGLEEPWGEALTNAVRRAAGRALGVLEQQRPRVVAHRLVQLAALGEDRPEAVHRHPEERTRELDHGPPVPHPVIAEEHDGADDALAADRRRLAGGAEAGEQRHHRRGREAHRDDAFPVAEQLVAGLHRPAHAPFEQALPLDVGQRVEKEVPGAQGGRLGRHRARGYRTSGTGLASRPAAEAVSRSVDQGPTARSATASASSRISKPSASCSSVMQSGGFVWTTFHRTNVKRPRSSSARFTCCITSFVTL